MEHHPLLLGVAPQLNLRAIGQFTHDIVQEVCRHSAGALLRHIGLHLFDNLALEIRSLELQTRAGRGEHHVRQDRNSRAPLDHARDVRQGFQELTTFDNKLHFSKPHRDIDPRPPHVRSRDVAMAYHTATVMQLPVGQSPPQRLASIPSATFATS